MTLATELLALYPRLVSNGYTITSIETSEYNCISWAAGDTRRWWWPSPAGYWPSGVRREEAIDAFEDAFATCGFSRCDSADLEDGFEKIAIYAKTAEPTHAARQLQDGSWSHKLGNLQDITAELSSFDSIAGDYGSPVRYMRRKRA